MGGGHSWETDHPDSSHGVYSYLITLKMNTIEINCGEKIVVDSRNYVTLCCFVRHVCIPRPLPKVTHKTCNYSHSSITFFSLSANFKLKPAFKQILWRAVYLSFSEFQKMGSILLTVDPSKSSTSISRSPNPFPLRRHAISTLAPSICSPIFKKKKWFLFSKLSQRRSSKQWMCDDKPIR